MQLYMRQKVMSLIDRFTVEDQFGNPCFYIEGELFTVAKKLHIYDMMGRQAAYVRRHIMSIMPSFYVFLNNGQFIEIRQRFSLFFPKYYFRGSPWTIEGDLMQRDYTIMNGNVGVAKIHKVWMSYGDAYQINVMDESDAPAVLASVCVIDYVLDRSSRKSRGRLDFNI